MSKRVSVILSLYNSERYLELYFREALKQDLIREIEFSIVHNQPTQKEKEIIEYYKDKLNIVYQEVELESLYKSWNRAIDQSSGEYIVCWNVDDLREYDSIKRMVETLDNNLDIGFTYGDIQIVKQFGSKSGRYVKVAEFTKNKGTTGAIGGPFFMWRRSLVEKVGYFDEQFKSGGDFDYTARLSIVSNAKKTQGIIGYFLHDSSGLSTRNKELQVLERTVIELRYGIWYKIDINYISKALSYNIKYITEFDRLRKVDILIDALSEQRRYWILFVLFGFCKNNIIGLLQKIKRGLIK